MSEKHINVSIFVPHLGCPHMCSFCNQRAISGKSKAPGKQEVIDAVETCLKGRFDPKTSEIAFFGGSFTAINREYMIELLESAYTYVEKGFFKGIRISTRPDCIDSEILDILKKYGVSSIELGCQSMDDRVLSMNERGHTALDCVNASNLIKKYDFELGLQMMTGLYGDDDETCISTARQIIKIHPDTVRIYPTIVLENTHLCDLYKSGKYKPQTLDESIGLCSTLLEMFNNANIKVIRLGLHSGGNVEDGYVSGPYHPAFREKCESRIYLDKIKKKLTDLDCDEICIFCAVGEKSKVIGQKRENIISLNLMVKNIKIEERESIQKGEIEIFVVK